MVLWLNKTQRSPVVSSTPQVQPLQMLSVFLLLAYRFLNNLLVVLVPDFLILDIIFDLLWWKMKVCLSYNLPQVLPSLKHTHARTHTCTHARTRTPLPGVIIWLFLLSQYSGYLLAYNISAISGQTECLFAVMIFHPSLLLRYMEKSDNGLGAREVTSLTIYSIIRKLGA